MIAAIPRWSAALVVGARPNFMKVAPLHKALQRDGLIEPRIVHTGQHYDHEMSAAFFDVLNMPQPFAHLEVKTDSVAAFIGQTITRFGEFLDEYCPDLVVVVGDVASTLACSIAARVAKTPLAHVEAGLRSFDRSMPEETNRVIVDHLSDILFVSEPSGLQNLRAEGIPNDRVSYVGNLMIDLLVYIRDQLDGALLEKQTGSTITATFHRPSNVDTPDCLEKIVEVLEGLSSLGQVVFPVHPRTEHKLKEFGLLQRLEKRPSITVTPPLNYKDFIALLSRSALVVTDLGASRKESTFLCVPCITLRENTERPATITMGTNQLASLQPETILRTAERLIAKGRRQQLHCEIPLWDGNAASRTSAELARFLSGLTQASDQQ